jgi:hypothetical protein
MNLIDKWAKSIEKHEGFYIGSRSWRNNNPGNFRYSKYTASLGDNKGKDSKNFIIYNTYDIGFNALKQFLTDACKGELRAYKPDMTLLQFYSVYAPSADGNSPLRYATFIANSLGVPITTKIKTLLQDNPVNTMKTPQEYFWQRNPRYKGIKLGNGNDLFQNYACFTCCLSYMVDKDPLLVMDKLKKNGGYSGSLIVSDKAAKILGLKYLGKDTNINNMPTWSPSIKEVLLGKSQHFVVRLITNGVRKIYDPWTNEYLDINHYKFVSYRLFK